MLSFLSIQFSSILPIILSLRTQTWACQQLNPHENFAAQNASSLAPSAAGFDLLATASPSTLLLPTNQESSSGSLRRHRKTSIPVATVPFRGRRNSSCCYYSCLVLSSTSSVRTSPYSSLPCLVDQNVPFLMLSSNHQWSLLWLLSAQLSATRPWPTLPVLRLPTRKPRARADLEFFIKNKILHFNFLHIYDHLIKMRVRLKYIFRLIIIYY